MYHSCLLHKTDLNVFLRPMPLLRPTIVPGFPRASEPVCAAAAQPRATAHPFLCQEQKLCVAASATYDFIFLEIEYFQVTNCCGFFWALLLSVSAMVSTLWKNIPILSTCRMVCDCKEWKSEIKTEFCFNEQGCGEAQSTNGWRLYINLPGFLLMEKNRSLAMPCKEIFFCRNSPCCFPQKILLWFFGPIPWLISSKIAPRFPAKSCCALLWVKTKCLIAFSGRNMDQRVLAWPHWSNVFLFCTGMAILLKIGSNVLWVQSTTGSGPLFCKRQKKSVLVRWGKFLCWRAITLASFLHFFICLPKIATWIFYPQGKLKESSAYLPKEAADVGQHLVSCLQREKIISKLPYARRIQGHFRSFSCSSVCIFN